ncbi:tetratricopeptide repeat protein [Aureibacter tunicatorum]|uniref:Tetratricopeptide (TPR) repeat protein n=1 Tax=Aureibacter tunicatorum TaxID=866807 RepID=A0AAE3XIA1_9BACT|nr:tetratricopeptide repeat protein [Aureibacter tunicatorum]MDR6237317.1 tetratricopeptide (TPR) repeat protein [Aureibacter tunicatorum]BDD06308.1 hypothetical protein AUTU_37910 [Aureibacter tunicatorum]
MSKQEEEEKRNTENSNEMFENPDALANKLESTTDNIVKNKQSFILVGGLLGLMIALFFAYNYYTSTQNAEAEIEAFNAIYYFEEGEYQKALDGDGNVLGFVDIINDFGSSKTANLAHYYAGASYLQLGKYDEAIEYLKGFSSNDLLLNARSKALIGDAYSEKKDYTQAAKYYTEAAGIKPNKQFSPQYLEKAAVAYEAAGDAKAAEKSYKKIVDEFQGSAEHTNARKQLTRLQQATK